MPPTSKSKQQKSKKMIWLKLPSDVMANILQRVGLFDILENAQKVCTTWRKICKDPSMLRVINMNNKDPNARLRLQEMCKHVVDRSQGQLVDLTIVDFADDELLQYIADRSSRLRRLEVDCCYGNVHESWEDALKKFPLLEELSLYITTISKEAIESAGRYCPMLTTLKVNEKTYTYSDDVETEQFLMSRNEIAIAIGENLPELRHLELVGNFMLNDGLRAILDGCRHLELIDLRRCFSIDLKGDFGKKCSENIKCLKLPNDSLKGCPFISGEYTTTYHASGFHEIIHPWNEIIYDDDDDVGFGFHEIIDDDDDDDDV